jgi:cytochrome c553
MQRFGKWLGIALAGSMVLVTVGALYVYGASEYALRRHYDFPLSTFSAVSDAAAVVRGKRVATLAGCANGCHGKNMEGAERFFDEPGVARINAPNLTHVLREYSDAELERLLRHGVKRDGTTAWIMPAPMFAHLSAQDMNDLVAFVRTVPERDGVPREFTAKPLARLGMVLGQFTPIVAQVDHALPRIAAPDRSDALKYGEYLVKTSCTECHGQNLEGSEFLHAPNLVIAQAYSEPDFFHLMRTGRGLGDRELGLMTEVATVRFPLFSDDEVRAVRLYLNAHAQGGADLVAPTEPTQAAAVGMP